MPNSDLTLSVVDNVRDLSAIRDEWDRLLHDVDNSNPYQSPAFVLTWYQHFVRNGRIHAVLIRRHGDLVGVAPFAVTTLGAPRLGFDLLINAGTEHGDYGEPLLAHTSPGAADLLADHLIDLVAGGTAAVNLRRLRDDGPMLGLLAARDDVRVIETAPPAEVSLVRFDLMDDPARAIESIAKRRDVPRNLRRLSEQFHVEERQLDVETGLRLMESLLATRWGAGEGPKAFASGTGRAFTYAVVESMAECRLATLHGLFADEQPVCVTLDLEVGDRRVGDMLAVNPEFHRFGPGHLQIYKVLQRALDDSMVELDFRAGDHPYKFKWANARRVSQSIALVRPDRIGDAQLLVRRMAMSYRARTMGRRLRPPWARGGE